MRLLLGSLLVIAGLLAGAASAQTPASREPAGTAERLVRQKDRLVGNILGDSPAGSRIPSLGDPEVARLLGDARALQTAAREAIARGDWAAADRRLNDAMWNIGRARQLAPDPAARQSRERATYERLVAGVASLAESYRRHSARAAGGSSGPPVQVDELLAAGKSHADAGRYRDAILSVEKAEQALLAGLNRVLGAKTLEYAQTFDTQLEEFAFELDRNRSYADLVPVAVAEFRPSEGARKLIDRYLQQNLQHRERAQEIARGGDWQAAIASIRNATTYLQRALSIAGLIAPTEAAFETEQ